MPSTGAGQKRLFDTTWQLLRFMRKYWILYVLALPGILFFLVFRYIPLLGSAIAFQHFSIFKGITGSPWAGFDQFRRMFAFTDFLLILKNTLLISAYDLIFAFPVPIILAILLNELRLVMLKRFIQTALYLPHFLSWIVVGGMIIGLLSPSTGLVNELISLFGAEPVYFLGEPAFIRSIIIGSGIWKESGWGMIVYLAAIAGIHPDLYESSQIDGAGCVRQAFSITIPSIMPTIVILFLLHVGNFLDYGFERVYIFLNPLNKGNAEIIDTYMYTAGLVGQQYSYTTAIGLFKSVVGLALLMIGNTLSKKATGSGLY
ncbi:ABC transporter permease subunit [Paenibacillus sp. J5C_2022]|uniref:ABC transporter permease n=1 Tax=Paenibacillus sp. J5C2022 TaxID=2977129 RepID=UPI0021CED277|nr:ABC transporter permease subunit [Paenibacillus sp. J5C2022]MCU6707526.1 ABC transporter permease subunit [Paenibacillus sp. J5C2022]